MRPFHLAFPVTDLEQAIEFYSTVLGCETGRRKPESCVLNLFGHQIVAHFSPDECIGTNLNRVDGDMVPSRHFGVILPWEQWKGLCKKMKKQKTPFMIEPKIRFKNLRGEQGTFFIQDPSRNVLEFKSFKNDSMVFEK